MSHPEARPERETLGPYQLGLLLGRGGMGEVYKAFDERLGRWVAVKRLRGEATARARERFRREARTLAQLGHPGIVQIFDIVEDEAGDSIVMELIDGPTLAELRRDGPLDVDLVLDYGRQIAQALDTAHANGIVHRDLKTENVMVLASGHVKVLDFGLASSVTAGRIGAAPGRWTGTPRSMSPEQALGHDVDGRSDLFSLGVLLYEISTARSPFVARTVEETLRRVIGHVPPPAHELYPRVPRELSELVGHLLEKEPALRPANAAAVADELAAIAIGDSISRSADDDLLEIETIFESAEGNEAFEEEVVVTTLLISDLVGSTRLVEKLGDSEAAALFRRHDQMARDLLEEHGGREIDKTDASPAASERKHGLLLFERPWTAVGYALAYHEGLAELGLEARVGIHLGEVILCRNPPADVERGAKPVEVEGLAKPAAARLMSLAAGGQTLLTRAAWEVARRSASSEGGGDLEWRAHGSYRFQGIGEEIEVFEVGVPGRAPLTAPAGSEKARRVEESATEPVPAAASVTLHVWPPPELPEQPYPVLLPYTHPALLAGRDAEIARLRRLLETPVPILGLSAPSGTGKSSLLVGGLTPTLRTDGHPVALVRHPAERGVAARLIGDLLDGAERVDDGDVAGFVERLAEVERLAGRAPVLVLDQFDDVLREEASAARAVLGPLMAASAVRRPGLETPPCRWLIAYREELSGRLIVWLGDVLKEARTAGVEGIEALPCDLSGAERFHSVPLLPLATVPAGVEEPLAEATRVFLGAIEKPLKAPSLPSPASGRPSPSRERGSRSETSGSPLPRGEGLGVRVAISEGECEVFPWHFAPGHARRLARAFAEARIARPDAPLAPELQVTLAHLLAEAGPDGRIDVPADPGPLIAEALDDHLRRALEAAFPAEDAASATRRARALLALRELATSTGERDEGLRPGELARAIGDDGEAILERLATPLTRLVMIREAADGPRWVLAHDRMAESVVRLVEEEGRHGQLVVDSELLAVRRFVNLRTALYRSREAMATRVPRRAFRLIEENDAALLFNDERRDWWTACRAKRRQDRRRFAAIAILAVLALTAVGWGAWSWARRLAEHQALLEQVAEAEPDIAFRALGELALGPRADSEELLALLRQREVPMDVLERGLGGLEGAERSAAVLRAVEIALPWVEEMPEDPVLLANLIWALDYAPGRDPPFAERARSLRDRVLEPLRRLRPPPLLPGLDDPDWVDVPAGRFLMGTGPDKHGQDDERPQHEVTVSGFRMQRHEVTNAAYRRLVPDHDPGADDDLPAAFVAWYAAYTYAAWLGGRLPTEAEWEYAARAGCPHGYCARNGNVTTVDTMAWTLRNSRNALTGELLPRPVMQLEPNPWGFYDMLGNVWEWTADWYGEYQDMTQNDPWGQAANAGTGRVRKGAGFGNLAAVAYVARRYGDAPSNGDGDQGFRPVLPMKPKF